MSDPIVIDKDIPIPPHGGVGRGRKYPWAEMNIGDSFFCDKKPANLSFAARNAALRLNRQFVIRKADGGCRVWRTA